MAYNHLTSSSGARRKGTQTFELRKLFDEGITAKSIYEPLECCLFDDDAAVVSEKMKRLDFDICGTKQNDTSRIEGYVNREQLISGSCSQYISPITTLDLVAESTPLMKVLGILKGKPHVFVLCENEDIGIISRADLQKMPVRILLFSLVSLFEMHLSDLIRKFYCDDSWKQELSNSRLEDAEGVLKKRIESNEELDLLSCIQLCDKKTLVLASEDIRKHFDFKDKRTAKRMLVKVEKIRNTLAHSQELASGMSWEEIIKVFVEIEEMLSRSDRLLQEEMICSHDQD